MRRNLVQKRKIIKIKKQTLTLSCYTRNSGHHRIGVEDTGLKPYVHLFLTHFNTISKR